MKMIATIDLDIGLDEDQTLEVIDMLIHTGLMNSGHDLTRLYPGITKQFKASITVKAATDEVSTENLG